ncbi:MAG: cupin-like domain-containing protein [Terracidiphilus sp.]
MFEDAASVDVALAPSVEEFAELYVRRERPVIVRGAVKDWPPSYKWTPEYLKAMYGARSLEIGVSTNGDYLDYAERLKIGVEPKVAFAKAVDSIFVPANADEKCRVHQQPLHTWGALNEESPPIPYILREFITKNIWMGSTGNVTKTHYDMEDNINIQLLGRKEIILFPSTQHDELYPRSAWDYMSNFSRVEIEKPDLSRYPLFSRATPFRAILEPGDFIYIPIYWWHQFRTLEASLNVNFWWQASLGQALRRHGLHYWPRMARDRYLHRTIWRNVVASINSSHGERKPDSRT